MRDCTHLKPGLMMIHGNRLETLRDLVVQWLKGHPLSPLENESFLIQSNGMAQWLKLAMAQDNGLGIAAALKMQLPSRFLWQVYRLVLGEQSVPKQSPFDKPQLRWRLLRMLPQLQQDPLFAPLHRFLADSDDLRKRDQLAEQLADLFDQYQVYRADWLAAWGKGENCLIGAENKKQPLPATQQWQPQLWRAILADMSADERQNNRANLHQNFIAKLKQHDTGTLPLPRRIIVFGISTLPQQTIEALGALAKHCQILLCIQNPCQHYWADIIEHQELLHRQFVHDRHSHKAGLARGLSPEQQHNQVNPLLAAWAKQGRDYIGLLAEYDQPEMYRAEFQQIDLFESPLAQHRHLLAQIQAGIFDLEPTPQPPLAIAPSDQSICLHLTHSRQREVEVLHDQLLQRFAEQTDLSPTDVIVMMPDVGQYAPHIAAVFGKLERDDNRYIPYTIADQTDRGHQALVVALETILSMDHARFSVSELLDLLAVPALRTKFNLTESDLPLLQRWIEQAGIRWGLDAEQRSQCDLPAELEQNSWRFGLDRMLLGYALGEAEGWSGIEPFAEIGGLDAAIIGSLAQLIAYLKQQWLAFQTCHHATEWQTLISEMVQQLFEPTDEQETQILAQFHETLMQWQENTEQAQLDELLPLNVIREVLLTPFEQTGVSQRFLAGKVNFCSMMPMRAIPFKQVCLLGLNDEDFPRSRPPLDFDLMAISGQKDANEQPFVNQYRPGDRSRREDDRYLFLEALLAARDQLYLSYVAASARDNSVRTPSVLLGQLLDHIKVGYCLADSFDTSNHTDKGKTLLQNLTIHHPLQPFNRRYFEATDHQLISYASEWLAMYQTWQAPMVTDLTRWQPQVAIGLVDLIALLKDPARLFLSRRLGVRFETQYQASDDLEPFGLDHLAQYKVRDELLSHLVQGHHTNSAQIQVQLQQKIERIQGRGTLPMGAFATLFSEHLGQSVHACYAATLKLTQTWTAHENIEFHRQYKDLILEGWLTDIHTGTDGLVRYEMYPQPLLDKMKLKNPLQGLSLYLHHLVACAEHQALTSYLIGSDSVWQIATLDAISAQQKLEQLLAHYLNAMNHPQPIGQQMIRAWFKHEQQAPENRNNELKKAYMGSDYGPMGDRDRSVYLARVFPDFEQIDLTQFADLMPLYTDLFNHIKRFDIKSA